VFWLQWFAEQGIFLEINHPSRKIVTSTPKTVELVQFKGSESSHAVIVLLLVEIEEAMPKSEPAEIILTARFPAEREST
jgi:hypothetical protein